MTHLPTPPTATQPVLSVRHLRKLFPVGQGGLFSRTKQAVHAVDDVSFELARGEVLALVGESGCGKSTLALSLMHLEMPSAGQVLFEGKDVTQLRANDLKTIRKQIQMIFQDPYESLNPLMTVAEIIEEPLLVHKLLKNKSERQQRVWQTLEDAGLTPPESYLNRYPHELSGGQRQRVVIAGALVLEPSLLLADEPVSMLDVSIRAEILNLLGELRDKRGISMLFITHDLSTAASFADRIAVMYLGCIVEIGPTRAVLETPQHPYTKALLSVIPVPNPRLRKERLILKGDPPNPVHLPSGCRFHPRCPVATENCKKLDPSLASVSENHEVACILVEARSQEPE